MLSRLRQLFRCHRGIYLLSQQRGLNPIPLDEPRVGIYEHYKGGLYLLSGSVMHAETNEVMVLYRAMNPDKQARERNPDGLAFVRPIGMFTEKVDYNGHRVPRFSWVTW